jgi:hypothetical protein
MNLKVDLLTLIVCNTVRNDKFKPSFRTAEKKKLKKPAQKRKKEKESLFNKKNAELLKEKLREFCTTQRKEKIQNEANFRPNNLWKAFKIAQDKSVLS